jgi:hypothetical protein
MPASKKMGLITVKLGIVRRSQRIFVGWLRSRRIPLMGLWWSTPSRVLTVAFDWALKRPGDMTV